jgi:hypothetical protein
VHNFTVFAQEINVFTLTMRPVGEETSKVNGFVSLSDIDRLSEHPDSLALPDFNNNEAEGYEKYSHIELGSKYRTRFLSRTNISETDKVFIYSYSKDTIVSIPVGNLKVVAWLNAYTSPEECPCPEYYYQIGFEIESKFLTGFENHFVNTLVFVGKKNPFVRNQVKPVVWQKIDSTEFPSNLISTEVNFNFGNDDYEHQIGMSYKFENQHYQFYIQELIKKDWQFGLRLLVVDQKTKEKIDERLYHSGESSSFAPLDNQWVGYLFKNKPMVIFGFKLISFGCPSITLLGSNEKQIVINCDNRH